jgi:hypothetical protein
MAQTTLPKKYAMVQLDADVHKLLKEYTDTHGFKIKGFVQNLIKKAIKDRK